MRTTAICRFRRLIHGKTIPLLYELPQADTAQRILLQVPLEAGEGEEIRSAGTVHRMRDGGGKMTNYERIKYMSVEEFIDEVLLNVPDDRCLRFIFGSWKDRKLLKQWLESEADNNAE